MKSQSLAARFGRFVRDAKQGLPRPLVTVKRWLWMFILVVATVFGLLADAPTVLTTLRTLFDHNGAAAARIFRDCETCPQMVGIASGSFVMGSPSHEEGRFDNEGPLHRVKIDHSIAMSVHEITRQQFGIFVTETRNATSSSCWIWSANQRAWTLRDDLGWRNPGYQQAASHPVACVSWYDARAYVDWLSAKTGHAYRLPSEAEWEYAVRGGTAGARHWGEDATRQCEFANGVSKGMDLPWSGMGVECDDGYDGTSPVGTYKSNGFGLYDMMGNVWEWTQDCWSDDYVGAPVNGDPWEKKGCHERVLRGGSRIVGHSGLRSAHRYKLEPKARNQNTGFRVVRST